MSLNALSECVWTLLATTISSSSIESLKHKVFLMKSLSPFMATVAEFQRFMVAKSNSKLSPSKPSTSVVRNNLSNLSVIGRTVSIDDFKASWSLSFSALFNFEAVAIAVS
ncbi:hypothetical protein WICPIJ_000630 [Wickerhamomyces pijperi]|uniref:Uncharacterized protein n=1 Tax=Wickerhamomyces pijperi TaxID=599730 RepID=A0A9P8QD57_WICPI|nr:hypothetical protein WICPIJ_000630 [Wickerhamomyces pijperi]